MFDIGFAELLMCGVVALLVLGPERLPPLARTLGRLMRRARDAWWGLRSEFEREIQADELRRSLDPARLIEPQGKSDARPEHPSDPTPEVSTGEPKRTPD